MRRPIPHTYSYMNAGTDWILVYAWWPTRTWDGRWAWLRPIWKRLLLSKEWLPGPYSQRWEYCLGQMTDEGEKR